MESKPNMSKTESVRTLMMQGDPCMIGVLFSFAMKGEGKRLTIWPIDQSGTEKSGRGTRNG